MTATLWAEIFPAQAWPGDDESAVRAMIAEIAALRMLTDNIVTTILEEHPVRGREEMQLAHDLLVQLVLDQPLFDDVVRPEDQRWVVASLEVLCWTLRHDHNQMFAQNFEAIQMRLAVLGFRIFRHPEMQYPRRETSP